MYNTTSVLPTSHAVKKRRFESEHRFASESFRKNYARSLVGFRAAEAHQTLESLEVLFITILRQLQDKAADRTLCDSSFWKHCLGIVEQQPDQREFDLIICRILR